MAGVNGRRLPSPRTARNGGGVSEFAKVDAELLERGFVRMVFDLSRIEELLDMLGTPQRAYQSPRTARILPVSSKPTS